LAADGEIDRRERSRRCLRFVLGEPERRNHQNYVIWRLTKPGVRLGKLPDQGRPIRSPEWSTARITQFA
jgi:hypothetical protein